MPSQFYVVWHLCLISLLNKCIISLLIQLHYVSFKYLTNYDCSILSSLWGKYLENQVTCVAMPRSYGWTTIKSDIYIEANPLSPPFFSKTNLGGYQPLLDIVTIILIFPDYKPWNTLFSFCLTLFMLCFDVFLYLVVFHHGWLDTKTIVCVFFMVHSS